MRWQGLLRVPGNHAGSPQVCVWSGLFPPRCHLGGPWPDATTPPVPLHATDRDRWNPPGRLRAVCMLCTWGEPREPPCRRSERPCSILKASRWQSGAAATEPDLSRLGFPTEPLGQWVFRAQSPAEPTCLSAGAPSCSPGQSSPRRPKAQSQAGPLWLWQLCPSQPPPENR